MKALLRKIRLTLGKLILDKKIPGKPLPTNPKIIVLQQDGKIGDYIISSFIFRELKMKIYLRQIILLTTFLFLIKKHHVLIQRWGKN